MSWITSFRLVLARFELLRVLIQLIEKYLFSITMRTHTMVLKIKKQNNFFWFTSYINLSGVFHTHSRVSNKSTVITICMYVCMYAFWFLFGLHVALQNLHLINVKILPVGCSSETVRLSVLFSNSLLHFYFILRNHLLSK